VSSFDVDVVDVVAGSVTGEGPRILVRVSGSSIDATGIGPGFSGSPIYCPDANGVQREIGAISESVGDAANQLALATPIEAILGEPLTPSDAPQALGRDARRSAARAARAVLRGPVRHLDAISVTGVAPWLGRLAAAGAHRAGRSLLAAPAEPLGDFAPVDLQPGSAVAVGLASGDLAAGAVGTVAYRDGNTIWAFGHPLDGAGPRSLLLQDAYVYGVIDNPGFAGASPKLAAPGHLVGTLRNDAANAVVGELGPGPATTPMDIVTRDADRGTTSYLHLDVADESAVGDPFGASPLRLVGAIAVAQAAATGLDGAPSRESARMCVKLTVRDWPAPIGFCNRYLTSAGGIGSDGISPLAAAAASDFDSAAGLIDDNTFAALHVDRVRVSLTLSRGAHQAYLVGAQVPRRVRAGQRIRARLRIRPFRGSASTLTVPLRVPRKLAPGPHVLALLGAGSDDGLGGDDEELARLFEGIFGGGSDEGDGGASSLPELAGRIAGLSRYDGITAGWLTRHGRRREPDFRPVYQSPVERISGQAIVPIKVVGRRR
jgi:hypothetical protein